MAVMAKDMADDRQRGQGAGGGAVLDRLVDTYPGPALIVGQGIRVVEANEDARVLVVALRAGHPGLIDLIERARHGNAGRKAEILLEQRYLFEVSAMPIGAAVLLMGRDVTEERLVLLRQTEAVERFADIIACSPDFCFETDRDGRFLFCAPDLMFGYRTARLVGRQALDLLDPEWLAGRPDPFVADQPVQDAEIWLVGDDGTRISAQLSARPVVDEAGHVVGLRGVVRDASAARARETALTLALDRERLRGAVVAAMRGEGGPERAIRVAAEASLATLHGAGVIVLARDEAGAMLPILHLGAVPAAAIAAVTADVAAICAQGQVVGRVETRPVGDHSALIAIAAESGLPIGALVLLRQGQSPWQGVQAGILGTVADQLGFALGIRDRVAQLQRQSRIDVLTGLMNRRAFEADMPGLLRRAGRDGAGGALLLIDLDEFKPLNDRYGHAVGDQVLQGLGRYFTEGLRPGDSAARLGGDEFAIWLPGLGGAAAFERAALLHDLPDRLEREFRLPDFGLGMSIGIGILAAGSDETLDRLMARTDAALYRAKAGGRNRAELAAPEERRP
ncbi:hypothetical protein DKG75_17160 [Zavarzinia compransoris]|uniref:GGDEF domain-containing protein n=2 Tax=Zavarzinia compransoris TaxID=1264899 RepID=A0A317DVK9_9PROT|nr:hypothetical protein DKG75_17160 [Zavarzinia compransoris]